MIIAQNAYIFTGQLLRVVDVSFDIIINYTDREDSGPTEALSVLGLWITYRRSIRDLHSPLGQHFFLKGLPLCVWLLLLIQSVFLINVRNSRSDGAHHADPKTFRGDRYITGRLDRRFLRRSYPISRTDEGLGISIDDVNTYGESVPCSTICCAGEGTQTVSENTVVLRNDEQALVDGKCPLRHRNNGRIICIHLSVAITIKSERVEFDVCVVEIIRLSQMI